MSETYYTKTHCWARKEDNGEVTVGITDYAQEQMSMLTFVEVLPGVGEQVEADDEIATLESANATNEVYCPVSGTVTAVNEELGEQPELVNRDPFGQGWLVRVRPDDEGELDNLLDADGYEAILPSEDE
ncbi:MAG: glycine cleavage system protein GcvH [Kiritimatiellae bacterium]|nr:glycine cleavage system protein GcvH [Kiritimatiellia bacterium]